MKNEKIFQMRIGDYEKPGLYLNFKNSTQLALTCENIDKITDAYWADPKKIPLDVKNALDFKRCDFCPLKDKDDFCDALRPTLPLLSIIDKYKSFDEVTAIYKEDDIGLCHVTQTTMQRAIRYISNLSLMEHCRRGRRYHKYFHGIIPIEGTEDIVNRLYLNIYWIHRGDEEAIDNLISQFKEDMTMATKNQMKRLRLICKNDSFLNAFVLTHLVTDLLYDYKDSKLRDKLTRREVE